MESAERIMNTRAMGLLKKIIPILPYFENTTRLNPDPTRALIPRIR